MPERGGPLNHLRRPERPLLNPEPWFNLFRNLEPWFNLFRPAVLFRLEQARCPPSRAESEEGSFLARWAI
jgi:hypothetical protein